ncbi:MAG: hypothetical protein EAZ51_04155 [Sphingobacteriales bacterium]|nr:MAG: hypothetical protein EAZ64_08180 [Sphingobacteriales bacterium]TAF81468.1 MAG: hypothetical protein EAZ51_04155 [Sphingobacteriales bacterium]
MGNNYWIKDDTRQEIITKTQIPNKGNFKLLACYFNLMDKNGLALHLNKNSELETEKLYAKNGFEYIVLENEELKELMVLPNQNITELAERVVSKIDDCKTQTEVLDLLIAEM